MSPNRNLSQQACLLLLIVSHYFKGERAQTQFWSNFEITKWCGYREYKVQVIRIILFCLKTMYLCKFDAENPTGSEETAQKRLSLHFLRMMILK